MQTLIAKPHIIRLLSLPCRNAQPTNIRAFSSSRTKSDINQSRGGLPRFFCPSLPPSKGGLVRIQGDEFRHMTKVLRLTVDDRVELFNGKGGLVEGCIQQVDQGGLEFVAFEDPKLVPPQSTQWHVFAAFGASSSTLKGGRADWLLEKCTELGACSITPLLMERCQSISENRMDRLERVILAAAKQCQRLHEMILHPPMKVDGLSTMIAQSNLSLLAAAEAAPVVNVLMSSKTSSGGVLIVGPEGDFREKEVKLMSESGATAVGLGPSRLRVETATIALLSIAMLWSDSHRMVDC